MAKNWDVIGHQNITKYLDNCLERNRLVNTYLFYGNKHLGKTTVANKFAEKLLNNDGKVSTDLFELKLEDDSKVITIEQVRDWQRWLSLKSFSGGYKVGIIHEMETLNRQSANALLKTIEEPSLNTIIILISSAWQELLPTIVSRAQKIHFLTVPNKELKEELSNKEVSQDKMDKIIDFSLGKPGLALKFIEDSEFFDEYLKLDEEIGKVTELRLAQRIKFIENYLTGKTLQDNNILTNNILKHLEFNLRKRLLNQLDDIKLFNALTKLEDSKKLLKYNIKPQLVLENLFINI